MDNNSMDGWRSFSWSLLQENAFFGDVLRGGSKNVRFFFGCVHSGGKGWVESLHTYRPTIQ
jgi:hypothetical protein